MKDVDERLPSHAPQIDDAPTVVEDAAPISIVPSVGAEVVTAQAATQGHSIVDAVSGTTGADAIEDPKARQEAVVDQDSEAETLIQSPEKKRLTVVDSAPQLQPIAANGGEIVGDNDAIPSKPGDNRSRKRKRSHDETRADSKELSQHSSPLASPAPYSPSGGQVESSFNQAKVEDKSSLPAPPEVAADKYLNKDDEDGDETKSWSRRLSALDTQPRSKSEFEYEHDRKHRPRHNSEAGGSLRRGTRSATFPQQDSPSRPLSPRPGEGQKRTTSAQSVQTLASHKARRIPTPLITRHDEHSDRSLEASQSPAPTHPTLLKLTPTENEATSPAKVMAKKLRDRHGRTWLAQACTDGKLDRVRQMYEERPQDLNVADNAGNTPVQIAALQGYVEIVDFLLAKNCEVNTRNIEKDTPLIDAVENGHVEVVRFLLDHGADPRLGNATGQKPLELVDEDDNLIRELLVGAINRSVNRRQSEDHAPPSMHPKEGSSRAASAASPRDSPPIHGPKSPPVIQLSRRRAREQTRNDLLWQANTPENLTKLAGKGDREGVVNILNILNRASPEALIAACKGGHDEVLELLIAMGKPDPDPEPVLSQDQRRGYNTPMLAAIGEGNLNSINLLLEQDGFNPTRECRGRTYFDISEERRGHDWVEERNALRNAYNHYRIRNQRSSTPRKAREPERRGVKDSSSPFNQQDRSFSRNQADPQMPHKVERSDDARSTDRRITDGKQSVTASSGHDPRNSELKSHRARRRRDELTIHSEEEIHKRRRLVSRKEHKKFHSDSITGSLEEEKPVSVKHEQQKVPAPRRRTSAATEPAPSPSLASLKKRSRRALSDSSPEDSRIIKKRMSSQDHPRRPLEETKGVGDVDFAFRETQQYQDSRTYAPGSSVGDGRDVRGRSSLETKRESRDDTDHERKERLHRIREAREVKDAQDNKDREARTRIKREAKIRTEEEARLAIERRHAEELAARKQAEEDAIAKKKAEEEIAARIAEEAVAKKKAEEEAAAQKEAEEEAAARKKAEEEAAARKKAEEEAAAKKKADEEALARKKEEEERRERMQREAEEKQRRAEERRQRIFRENEQRRMAALPKLLCKSAQLLDQNSAEAKSSEFLSRFLPLFTVKTQQIDPFCPREVADEDWFPGFQAAPLLAVKNLGLEHFTHWEKRKVNDGERLFLWKVARTMLIQGDDDIGAHALNMSMDLALKLDRETQPKFQAMQPLVWVKVSDFRERLPLHPYLQALVIKTQKIGLRLPKALPKALPNANANANAYPGSSFGLTPNSSSNSSPSPTEVASASAMPAAVQPSVFNSSITMSGNVLGSASTSSQGPNVNGAPAPLHGLGPDEHRGVVGVGVGAAAAAAAEAGGVNGFHPAHTN